MRRRGDPLVRAGWALPIVAGALVGVAAWRSLVLEPLPGLPAASPPPVPSAVARPDAPADSVLLAAVEADPFHPERRRPAVPYTPPGEEPAATVQVAAEAEPAGSFRLVGTAVLPDGKSFAMFEWPGRAPRLVRIGQSVAGLTLERIEPGRAILVSAAGATVVVDVPEAGS